MHTLAQPKRCRSDCALWSCCVAVCKAAGCKEGIVEFVSPGMGGRERTAWEERAHAPERAERPRCCVVFNKQQPLLRDAPLGGQRAEAALYDMA